MPRNYRSAENYLARKYAIRGAMSIINSLNAPTLEQGVALAELGVEAVALEQKAMEPNRTIIRDGEVVRFYDPRLDN